MQVLADGPVVVPGDEHRLRQVVANLVTNSLVHGGQSTVTLRAAIEGSHAVLSVADDGPGMPAEDAARAFDRFWRGDSSRQRRSGSSGLGLAIVRAVAEAHGGSADVLSSPGKGTTFTIRLPRQR